MEGFAAFVVWTMFTCLGAFIWGEMSGQESIMKEAFERNVAVQCVGLEGYYWECPTESK